MSDQNSEDRKILVEGFDGIEVKEGHRHHIEFPIAPGPVPYGMEFGIRCGSCDKSFTIVVKTGEGKKDFYCPHCKSGPVIVGVEVIDGEQKAIDGLLPEQKGE
jgi:hypothetical protein